jgi:predicted ArsR family transcriptional regulator
VKFARETTTAAPATAAAADAHAGTRERVALTLLENGPSTAVAVAERLGVTAAAVRRHLDALVEDGFAEPRPARTHGQRGRGRPAKVVALTDTGREAFYQAYDDLAASALRYLADAAGERAVTDFARQRVAELESRYRPAVDAAAPEERTRVLAHALTADGYAASAGRAPAAVAGEQLCQHHCPVAHVAEQFPQLCEAETEAFARLLGRHVQRLATIAHGDGVCTTFVPASPAHDDPYDPDPHDPDTHADPAPGRTPA